MTDNYLAEIRLFSCNFAPNGWALCDGSILQVKQYAALFSLIGKNFGGDGINTFALPDLRGRVPINIGQGTYALGYAAGVENVTLTASQMPVHNHAFMTYPGAGNVNEPNNIVAIPAVAGATTEINMYNSNVTTQTTFNTAAVASVGAGEAHTNMQPFLTLNFCIAMQGIYPPRP